MSKRIKSFILAIIMLVICTLSFSATASNKNRFDLNTETHRISSFLANQDASCKAQTKILEYFESASSATPSNGCYTYNGLCAESFPAYYAGAYINPYGELVILLSQGANNLAVRTELDATADAKLLYRTVKYSYRELLQGMDRTQRLLLSENSLCISAFELDDYNNCINVYFKTVNEDITDRFLENVSHPEIYRFFEDACETEALLYTGPGNPLDYGSLGYRARQRQSDNSYKYGFVTAGHCYLPGDSVYYYSDVSSNYLGVATTSWQYSGTVDAVFVEHSPSSNYSITNDINGTSYTLSVGYTTVLQGTSVSKSGKTTGVTSGTVVSASCSVANMTDFIRVSSLGSDNGDSGGIVYREPTSGVSAFAVGIVSARILTSPYDNLICKYANIASALNVYIY